MEPIWYDMRLTAHQTFFSGTVNIVSIAQLELNLIQKNNNVIIAQTDLSATKTATYVFQDFDWTYLSFILFNFSIIQKTLLIHLD